MTALVRTTTLLAAILLFSFQSVSAAPNTLRFSNRSGEDAVVRVFKQRSSSRVAEVRVPNGRTRGTGIRRGTYYIVVKYRTRKGVLRYAKGDPFKINPPSGHRTRATITLHGVRSGNYRAEPCDSREFGR